MQNLLSKTIWLLSLLTIWILGACNSENKQVDTENTGIDSTMDDIAIHSAADMSSEDDYVDYTYSYVEPDNAEVPPADGTKAKNDADRKKTPPKLKVKDTPVIYTVSQTDRPPLFTPDCITAKNPQKCSNKALASWARNNVKYPETDLAEGSDGLEYVTFVINENGKVSSISRVDSKQEACDGCSKAVIDAVLDMPDWQPAMLGGKPVNVQVTLPVRFRVL